MKLSCTQISLGRELSAGTMDVRGFIDFCAETGFEAVDLLEPTQYAALWKDAATDSKAITGWITGSGLKLAALGCGNNFAQLDPAARAAQVDGVIASIHRAAELGAPVVRIFGGTLREGVDSAQGMRWVMDGIEAVLPAAEKSGVVLGLENHGALPGHAFELEAVLRSFGSPHLRCTFDCANFMANNMLEVENPINALGMLQGYIAHAHVKDFRPHPDPSSGKRVQACVAGEGDVPLRQLTAALAKSGYSGFYTLEYEAGHAVPEREGVRRSFAYLDGLRKLHTVLKLAASRT